MRTVRSFPATAESVPAARRFVMRCLPALEPTSRDGVALMVSELVTNAIVYGMTTVDVAVDLVDDDLRVEVSDGGGGTPVVRPLPDPSSERGRGLRIVRALSDRWGVEAVPQEPGKSVWFELEVHGSAAPA